MFCFYIRGARQVCPPRVFPATFPLLEGIIGDLRISDDGVSLEKLR